VLGTEIVQGSGNRMLDRRAEAIARAAGPSALQPRHARQADQIVVISRFRFTRDDAGGQGAESPRPGPRPCFKSAP
jgi:protein TonB